MSVCFVVRVAYIGGALFSPRRRFTTTKSLAADSPPRMDPEPEIYRMRLFAPNPVTAKSRFWYFMHRLEKKKGTGRILSVNEVVIG